MNFQKQPWGIELSKSKALLPFFFFFNLLFMCILCYFLSEKSPRDFSSRIQQCLFNRSLFLFCIDWYSLLVTPQLIFKCSSICRTASLLVCPKQMIFKQINCVLVNIWRKGEKKRGRKRKRVSTLHRLLSQGCWLARLWLSSCQVG